MSNNIFDLSKIAAPSYDVENKYNREINQESLLEGYEPVDRKDWRYIINGSHIRYLRKDGSFRKGGIVNEVWISKDSSGNDVIRINISANYGDKKWSINDAGIEKRWVKKNSQHIMVNNYSELREDVENCKESIKQLSIQIQKINSEQMRIVNLIKKLHNLK